MLACREDRGDLFSKTGDYEQMKSRRVPDKYSHQKQYTSTSSASLCIRFASEQQATKEKGNLRICNKRYAYTRMSIFLL